jgi:hypothetical protein
VYGFDEEDHELVLIDVEDDPVGTDAKPIAIASDKTRTEPERVMLKITQLASDPSVHVRIEPVEKTFDSPRDADLVRHNPRARSYSSSETVSPRRA